MRKVEQQTEGVRSLITGDLANPKLVLPQVDTVIHAAGLGHRRNVKPHVWRRANVEMAVNVARAAKAAGATKFILISTAYIYGRSSDRLVTDTTPPNPPDDYTESKYQAELEVAASFGHDICSIRPAAVIGPACPGNIQLLLRAIKRGIPLPFGAIQNKRSFIARDDLAAIVLAALQARTLPEVILAAHPEAISTPDLIRALGEGMGCTPREPRIPLPLLAVMAGLAGRAEMWESLSQDFRADPKTAYSLGWKPAASLEETLKDVARYYITTNKRA